MHNEIARKAGFPGWWDEVGRLQFDALKAKGLRPSDRLLDVGCGPFRAGRFFIAYLDAGHYTGLDRRCNVLVRAWNTVLTQGLRDRQPLTRCTDVSKAVDLHELLGGQRFDHVLIYAVFDHLPPAGVRQVLANVAPVLAPAGTVWASAFIAPEGHRGPLKWGKDGLIATYPDREYWHYTLSFLEQAAADAGLKMAGTVPHRHPLGLTMFKAVRA